MNLASVPGGQVDARIAPDVRALLRLFGLKITSAYDTTGHAADGEHPLGLAVDLVPVDGNWDRAARAAAFAKKHPRTFRWVGYNGEPGHGDPAHAGANAHLHLSWFGRPGTTVTPALAGHPSAAAGGKARPLRRNPDGSPAAADTPAAKSDPIGDAASAAGSLIVRELLGGLEETGARLLVTVALILGGAMLTFYGAMKLAGVSPRTVANAATTAATVAAAPETGGASLAAGAGAKTAAKKTAVAAVT